MVFGRSDFPLKVLCSGQGKKSWSLPFLYLCTSASRSITRSVAGEGQHNLMLYNAIQWTGLQQNTAYSITIHTRANTLVNTHTERQTDKHAHALVGELS